MKRLVFLLALALLVVGLMAGSALAAPTIVNGGFESGNSGFTSDYAYVATSGGSALWDPGTYAVGSNPALYHSLWSSFTAHDGTLMLIANGSSVPNANVWEQTVTGLVPGHVYQLSAEISSSYPSAPAVLSFKASNNISGSAFETDTTAPTPGVWTHFEGAVIIPADVTSGEFSIGNQNIAYGGNDFCIDDIALTDLGSPYGKATGGIKFMAGATEVQLDFVAMSTVDGAKGIVKYKNSVGGEFMGNVTGYYQNSDGTVACFVGEISKKSSYPEATNYFYVAVGDGGEPAIGVDHGVRVLVGSTPYQPLLSLATGSYDVFTGNVQIH